MSKQKEFVMTLKEQKNTDEYLAEQEQQKFVSRDKKGEKKQFSKEDFLETIERIENLLPKEDNEMQRWLAKAKLAIENEESEFIKARGAKFAAKELKTLLESKILKEKDKKKKRLHQAIALVGLLIAGCSGVGQESSQNKVDQIKQGQIKQAEKELSPEFLKQKQELLVLNLKTLLEGKKHPFFIQQEQDCESATVNMVKETLSKIGLKYKEKVMDDYEFLYTYVIIMKSGIVTMNLNGRRILAFSLKENMFKTKPKQNEWSEGMDLERKEEANLKLVFIMNGLMEYINDENIFWRHPEISGAADEELKNEIFKRQLAELVHTQLVRRKLKFKPSTLDDIEYVINIDSKCTTLHGNGFLKQISLTDGKIRYSVHKDFKSEGETAIMLGKDVTIKDKDETVPISAKKSLLIKKRLEQANLIENVLLSWKKGLSPQSYLEVIEDKKAKPLELEPLSSDINNLLEKNLITREFAEEFTRKPAMPESVRSKSVTSKARWENSMAALSPVERLIEMKKNYTKMEKMGYGADAKRPVELFEIIEAMKNSIDIQELSAKVSDELATRRAISFSASLLFPAKTAGTDKEGNISFSTELGRSQDISGYLNRKTIFNNGGVWSIKIGQDSYVIAINAK